MILAASIYWKSWGIFHFGELFQVDDSFSFDVLSSFTMGIGYCIAEFQDLIVFWFHSQRNLLGAEDRFDIL